MFQKITPAFFKNSISRAGISKQLHAQKGIFIAKEILQERFGKDVSTYAEPKYIKYRVLTIVIFHPAIAEQIRLQEEGILKEINKKIGRDDIVRIQFSVDTKDQKDLIPPHPQE